MKPQDYELLANFRYELRRFLSFSAQAARDSGLSPQQHQALLAIKAAPTADLTIGELATRLQIKHHSTVGLVDRLVRKRLVARDASRIDRRRVQIKLTALGEKTIAQLSSMHRQELRRIGPDLRKALKKLARV